MSTNHLFRRAHPVPHLEEHGSEASLIDVDSPHVQSVTSDYREQEVKTDTQAERMAQEAERDTEIEAKRAEDKAQDKAQEVKKKAAHKGKEAKAELKKEARKFDENKDNPVFIGNYVLWGLTAAAVGYGAYQRHSEGKLDVETVGTVALGLGALGLADYFASK